MPTRADVARGVWDAYHLTAPVGLLCRHALYHKAVTSGHFGTCLSSNTSFPTISIESLKSNRNDLLMKNPFAMLLSYHIGSPPVCHEGRNNGARRKRKVRACDHSPTKIIIPGAKKVVRNSVIAGGMWGRLPPGGMEFDRRLTRAFLPSKAIRAILFRFLFPGLLLAVVGRVPWLHVVPIWSDPAR